jgi:hypothetical protein
MRRNYGVIWMLIGFVATAAIYGLILLGVIRY